MDEFDLIVIGSGPGGYVAAIRAAELGLKTACIEKGELGGTCLNVGCIPSKTLLHASEFFSTLKNKGKDYGILSQNISYDFAQMMQRKQEVINTFRMGIGGLFKRHKVTHIQGTASLLSETTVTVNGTTLKSKAILLATGSTPKNLPFLKIDEKRVLSSTGALSLSTPPKKLLIIGAGVIGVELGSVYQRLGTEVIFIEFCDQICPTFDGSISKELHKSLKAQGMTFHLGAKVVDAKIAQESVTLSVTQADGSPLSLEGDYVLLAVGRVPYTEGLGLSALGLDVTKEGLLPVDASFRTKIPSIFAIGDLIDGPMLAHKASEEGIAVAELLAGKKPLIDYASIPNIIYTHPEAASVGLTEEEAKKLGLNYKAATSLFKVNSRAKCSLEEEGFVKILAEKTTGKLIGIHILGAHASELIAEGALAIYKRLSIEDLARTPHAHPTLSEAIKETAASLFNS